MKGLTIEGFQAWLSSHVPGSCGEAPAYFPAIPLASLHSLGRDLPVDTGKKVFLAKAVFERLRSEKEFLLWLHDWVVCRPAAIVPLILRLRESPGESRGLEDAPGSLSREKRSTTASPSSSWRSSSTGIASWWVRAASFAFFTSHDEFCSVMSTDESEPGRLDDPLGPAGVLKAIDHEARRSKQEQRDQQRQRGGIPRGRPAADVGELDRDRLGRRGLHPGPREAGREGDGGFDRDPDAEGRGKRTTAVEKRRKGVASRRCSKTSSYRPTASSSARASPRCRRRATRRWSGCGRCTTSEGS